MREFKIVNGKDRKYCYSSNNENSNDHNNENKIAKVVKCVVIVEIVGIIVLLSLIVITYQVLFIFFDLVLLGIIKSNETASRHIEPKQNTFKT